jgi:hypothetical protein
MTLENIIKTWGVFKKFTKDKNFILNFTIQQALQNKITLFPSVFFFTNIRKQFYKFDLFYITKSHILYQIDKSRISLWKYVKMQGHKLANLELMNLERPI